MTTDITALAQSLKNAASKALIEEGLTWFSEEQLSHEDGIAIHKADAEFIALANPANVLALVEALEKAQQVDEELGRLLPPGAEYMDPPDGGNVTPLEGVRRMIADYRQRIAELESRAVIFVDCDFGAVQHMSGGSTDYCHGFVDGTQNAIRAISAAGIKVEAE